MAAEMRPIAVKTEAAMFAALAGIVAMMVFMAIGGSGFFMAGFRGLLAALVVFVALLALLPAPAEALAEATADPEAEAAEPAAVAAEPMETAPEAGPVASDMPAPAVPAAEPEATPVSEASAIAAEPVAPAEAAPDAPVPAPDAADAAVADVDGEASAIAPAGAARPAALAAPRGGAADDLKRIRGVGPKLEGALNAAGFWHFDQIAGWSAAELAWVDDQVPGVRGRATRDDWVGQAKRLAAAAAPVAG